MKNKITIQGVDVEVKKQNSDDYISLTDMLRAKDGEFFISDWLRNRNTLEYLGIWEKIHNPNFNYGEFATIKSMSGLNNFKISVQEFVSKTNAISLFASAGRYGGTFAHKDIAFEFGMWISPEFKIYLVKEFQRLKENENAQLQWTAHRELAKLNYHIQTDAIKKNLIVPKLTAQQISFVYASEADLLNVALFGHTASEWRTANPAKKGNVRDYATVHQLLVLANMESYNAVMIKDGLSAEMRIQKLNDMAMYQLPILIQSSSPLLLDEGNKK
ncbi:MAG: KilA-N domain-containing protein [Methanosarcinales archaeon]|jgi:hypothetical protein|nr:KilA-N domain-containing protein [Methanosarcinales archaeon]